MLDIMNYSWHFIPTTSSSTYDILFCEHENEIPYGISERFIKNMLFLCTYEKTSKDKVIKKVRNWK